MNSILLLGTGNRPCAARFTTAKPAADRHGHKSQADRTNSPVTNTSRHPSVLRRACFSLLLAAAGLVKRTLLLIHPAPAHPKADTERPTLE